MREQPPYLRFADVLRKRIESQEWMPGDRLPSRAQLAQECGVTDGVVRRAQEVLIEQGVLEGRAGSGTYVAQSRERVRLVRSREREQVEGLPFHADMAALGKRATWESRTDGMVPAPPHIAVRLGISEGDYCVRTGYEFMADGKPVQIATSWEPYAITSGSLVVLPEAGPMAGKGVVRRMAEIGITVSRSVERPEAGHAETEEANLLGIQRGALVMRIQRTYFDDGGRPVETADIVVPTALSEIVYEVPINP
ncbi:GntR family transcriptional regulator [Streptomyces griseocarneus]|uniref:GntR family transcriptional regulator n=1 Tax=Streptomyces griseocarneus TaxID=51201 RepID=UPI00167EEB5D|nr:GntR family transcriptional regulator [Streptomyces griseocarneus]MBZ6473208.1 GntR family transcriptional regulator [Streptomyces griseocarneus]GHG60453.1 GntR family transcriptional regulator [Streptomyces griseocarneus]